MATSLVQTLCVSCRPAAYLARAPNRSRAVRIAPVRSTKNVDLGGDPWELVESAASSDDILLYYNHASEEKHSHLGQVMQKNVVTTTPSAKLSEVAAMLENATFEGMPVVDRQNKLVGVISKKDLTKGGVHDVMSSPAVALKVSSKVGDAATLMVEHKFHRMPVVDDDNELVGIVTRTDLFWAMSLSVDSMDDGESHFSTHGATL